MANFLVYFHSSFASQRERSALPPWEPFSRLIRALSRLGAAAVWSFKPLFDLMVLLLTVYKSAKFKRIPRPALIDVLIADGTNPSVV